jgi:hypothetical protein
MALVKYGGGVTQLSGSVGGTTYARNRFGNYMRSRTKPVNPGTQAQDNVRTSMSFLTAHWSTVLTAGERIAWATYAAAIAMKNRLGETVYLTGFNHFVRSNVEHYRLMSLVTKTGPAVLTLPAKDVGFTCSGSVATQLITVNFTENTEWAIEVGAELFLYQGQPRSHTHLFFAGPWKVLGMVYGTTTPGAQSPVTKAAVMTLTLGQLITVYARIRRADGRLSEPFQSTFTVVA